MASSNWPYHITFEMKKLERELAASQAEVERLDQMVEWFIENAPHFTVAQFNEHQRTLNPTDK